MVAPSISPPRVEHGFRTRSADADWDFFPFGPWGRGYRVNEAQRARLLRIQNWIAMGGLPPLALFIVMDVMDAANPWGVVPLALVVLVLVGLPSPAQWLYVRRLPPAERPLTQQDICGFIARTQSRGWALRVLILAPVLAVASLFLFAAGVRVVMTTVSATYGWAGIAAGTYFSATLAYKAWQAYCVRRLQGRLKLSAPD